MSAINSATSQHVPGMTSLETVVLPAHRGVGSSEMLREFYQKDWEILVWALVRVEIASQGSLLSSSGSESLVVLCEPEAIQGRYQTC